jgi:hypothetical protein
MRHFESITASTHRAGWHDQEPYPNCPLCLEDARQEVTA